MISIPSNKYARWSCVAISILLIVLAFSDIITNNGLDFMLAISERALAGLAIVSELQVLVASGSSSNIPLISGLLSGGSGILEEVSDHLIWSNILIGLQIILLKLSMSIVIKIALVLALAACFIKQYRTLALKLFVLILCINPGLPLYIGAIHYVTNEMELDTGISLKTELEATKVKFTQKRNEQQQKNDERTANAQTNAEAKGKKQPGLIKRELDKVENTVSDAVVTVEEGASIAGEVFQVAGKKLIEYSLNFLISTFMLFLLLPFLYFYLMNLLIKRLLGVVTGYQIQPFAVDPVEKTNTD